MMNVHDKHIMMQPNCAALGPSAISIKMSAGCADQATKLLKIQIFSSHLRSLLLLVQRFLFAARCVAANS